MLSDLTLARELALLSRSRLRGLQGRFWINEIVRRLPEA
jgi:hypothetical protein